MMWRTMLLLGCLLCGLCGCLATMTGGRTSGSASVSQDIGVLSGDADLPTPQLFGLGVVGSDP